MGTVIQIRICQVGLLKFSPCILHGGVCWGNLSGLTIFQLLCFFFFQILLTSLFTFLLYFIPFLQVCVASFCDDAGTPCQAGIPCISRIAKIKNALSLCKLNYLGEWC